MLLAIDTSAGTSVAIVDGTRVLAERSVADTMRHAEVIGSLISGALADAAVSPSDLDAVAAGMGPAPFTGLRVGIAAARVFALGIGAPLLPVVSHDAIAFDWYSGGGVGSLTVVTDARRRELYYCEYSGCDADGIPTCSAGPGLSRPDVVPADGATRLDAARVSAARLGTLAALMRSAGHPFADDRPLYLRSPDVTLTTARKRVTG